MEALRNIHTCLHATDSSCAVLLAESMLSGKTSEMHMFDPSVTVGEATKKGGGVGEQRGRGGLYKWHICSEGLATTPE